MKPSKKRMIHIIIQLICLMIITIMLFEKPIWIVVLGMLLAVLPGVIIRADMDYQKYFGDKNDATWITDMTNDTKWGKNESHK